MTRDEALARAVGSIEQNMAGDDVVFSAADPVEIRRVANVVLDAIGYDAIQERIDHLEDGLRRWIPLYKDHPAMKLLAGEKPDLFKERDDAVRELEQARADVRKLRSAIDQLDSATETLLRRGTLAKALADTAHYDHTPGYDAGLEVGGTTPAGAPTLD